jgi:hypothetical protein
MVEKGCEKESSMGGRSKRYLLIIAASGTVLLLVFAAFAAFGCNGEPAQEDQVSQVAEAATAFLNACGDMQADEVRSFFSQDYLQANQVPDPLTQDDLAAALGYLNSYRLLPDQDISVEGDRAVVSVTIDTSGKGEMEETMVFVREDGQWKVESFTAMDWSAQTVSSDGEQEQVEQALNEFLIACIDQNTIFIFEHLSEDYKEKHRLEKPWTAAEYSGIFGTARSFDFDPNDIEIENSSAEVDVTIEFGTRGNLESETSRVRLVKEGNEWLVDVFPFFIY